MAKDYKNTKRPKDDTPKPTPGWVWMLGGLLIGLFVALLVYLKDDLPELAERAKPAPVVDKSRFASKADKQAAKKKAAAEKEAEKKPRFDFYNLLPEMEVFIPPQEVAKEREKTSESITYYLQAGSFRHMEDADRMRAQLALNNIESHIQRVTINDSQTWYRVRVGPFQSARKMDKVRNRLREQSVDPIVLKVK
jgi:cell division protein FtsN